MPLFEKIKAAVFKQPDTAQNQRTEAFAQQLGQLMQRPTRDTQAFKPLYQAFGQTPEGSFFRSLLTTVPTQQDSLSAKHVQKVAQASVVGNHQPTVLRLSSVKHPAHALEARVLLPLQNEGIDSPLQPACIALPESTQLASPQTQETIQQAIKELIHQYTKTLADLSTPLYICNDHGETQQESFAELLDWLSYQVSAHEEPENYIDTIEQRLRTARMKHRVPTIRLSEIEQFMWNFGGSFYVLNQPNAPLAKKYIPLHVADFVKAFEQTVHQSFALNYLKTAQLAKKAGVLVHSTAQQTLEKQRKPLHTKAMQLEIDYIYSTWLESLLFTYHKEVTEPMQAYIAAKRP